MASTVQAQCTFELLSPDPTTEMAELSAISRDGRIAVGRHKAAGKFQAYRWTDVGVGQFLGPVTGHESFAYDVSDDGSVVVGQMYPGPGLILHAFRWTQATGMKSLGTAGLHSAGSAISGNGLVTVGFDWDPLLNAYGVTRWTDGGAKENLGLMPGGYTSTGATAVNVDGSVLAGHGSKLGASGKWVHKAFRWTQQTGIQPLADLGGELSLVEDSQAMAT